jgi:hypothetical protein
VLINRICAVLPPQLQFLVDIAGIIRVPLTAHRWRRHDGDGGSDGAAIDAMIAAGNRGWRKKEESRHAHTLALAHVGAARCASNRLQGLQQQIAAAAAGPSRPHPGQGIARRAEWPGLAHGRAGRCAAGRAGRCAGIDGAGARAVPRPGRRPQRRLRFCARATPPAAPAGCSAHAPGGCRASTEVTPAPYPRTLYPPADDLSVRTQRKSKGAGSLGTGWEEKWWALIELHPTMEHVRASPSRRAPRAGSAATSGYPRCATWRSRICRAW